MKQLKHFKPRNKTGPSPLSKHKAITTLSPTPSQNSLPDLPNNNSEPSDGMRVGESPVPGLSLKHILRGHKGSISNIAWSPDGRFLASSSDDKTIRIWNVVRGECTTVLKGHKDEVTSVAWSPDGSVFISGANDGEICFWSISLKKIIKSCRKHEGRIYKILWSSKKRFFTTLGRSSKGSNMYVVIWDAINLIPKKTISMKSTGGNDIEWSPDGNTLAIGKAMGVIKLLSMQLKGHSNQLTEANFINHMAWSPKGNMLASGDYDFNLRIWDIPTRKLKLLLEDNGFSSGIIWMLNEKTIITCNYKDSAISIWNAETGQLTTRLEGHTSPMNNISLSYSGNLLASCSEESIRLWSTKSWNNIASIRLSENESSFHPTRPILVTWSRQEPVIRIWDIDMDVLLSQTPIDSVRYTTAKLALVGDSGVGKTGLGWRLAHGKFKEHSSTHGQQFWVIDDLCTTRTDGTECEAVLWDLAGQPDYRLVHSLFLDDVDTAMVLFDPTNRQEPLSGVDFWLNQLRRKDKNLCNSILIGARSDRGSSTLTDDELQAYCERNGICGGNIQTSAKDGTGLDKLMVTLKTQIPWNEMTATVTTLTFKRIKEYVLGLKEQTDRKNVLVHPEELRLQLQVINPDWEFSDAEMMTAIGHLANHGYVTVLRGSLGTQSFLLAPDLLVNLASSIVLEARRSPRGLGVLEENHLLAGNYHFPELHDLDKEEIEILLDAATVLFLEHNLCFRESFNQQTFLVFPSLINEKRPKDEDFTQIEGASYRVKGAVENVYASLVVMLGYTNTFIRTHQWQNQAQYEMGDGEICGFQQTDNRDGEIELVLYYAHDTPDPIRMIFRGLFERFLSRHELDISRYQPVQCDKCGSVLARNVVLAQLEKDKKTTFCHECGKELPLPDPESVSRLSRREEIVIDAQQTIAKRRTTFEAALVRVKALLRDQDEDKKPTCFISYAWGIPENERWVLQLAKDLRNAGIDVLFDRWDCPPGSNLDLFIERIMSSDYVIPIGTPSLREKYDTQEADPVVAAELKLINLRVRQTTEYGETILPVLLDGTAKTSFSPQLQPLVCVDIRDSDFYFQKLFKIIWRIYELPFDNPLLEELQESMCLQRK